ncbi:hypothetical protein GLOTRDRAFT_95993 [Gloeophyllum trabeum ATCC 11539]|uniref:Uncharacterized protein n=1 Tax=Gloeophyllum trabeum (strain ATCC 11539 / FP-39264 / Madison 617) TaxID=670483 RepID=S7PVQ4_GLOTA|nr:uncharacterized protein GLOTRDRAFT_95993 [Gloeophyllum trabeum ATCC 11539]EPQ51711.1 hypothetical protein GLOTRDRAFT_95993 [Gloeophyllum trabeum ATCC 11539]
MCTSIGVNPLAGPRRGGWWAELTGIDDWQHELGVQIVDCVSTRERNGGLIDLAELIRLVSRLSSDVDVGGGRKMVRSVVKELDDDKIVVIAVAEDRSRWTGLWRRGDGRSSGPGRHWSICCSEKRCNGTSELQDHHKYTPWDPA